MLLKEIPSYPSRRRKWDILRLRPCPFAAISRTPLLPARSLLSEGIKHPIERLRAVASAGGPERRPSGRWPADPLNAEDQRDGRLERTRNGLTPRV